MNDDIELIIQAIVDELEFSRDDSVQLFTEFLASLPSMVSDLEDAIGQADYDRVGKVAHSLKGASSNLRVDKLTQLSVKLREASLKNDKTLCIKYIDEIGQRLEILNSLLLKFIHVAS